MLCKDLELDGNIQENGDEIIYYFQIPSDLELSIRVQQLPLRNRTFWTTKIVWVLILLGSICALLINFLNFGRFQISLNKCYLFSCITAEIEIYHNIEIIN